MKYIFIFLFITLFSCDNLEDLKFDFSKKISSDIRVDYYVDRGGVHAGDIRYCYLVKDYRKIYVGKIDDKQYFKFSLENDNTMLVRKFSRRNTFGGAPNELDSFIVKID